MELNDRNKLNNATEQINPLELLKSKMMSNTEETKEKSSDEGFSVNIPDDFFGVEEKETKEEMFEEEKPKESKKPLSFLKRMRRYTTDEDGTNIAENREPDYQLESVDEILGIKKEEEKSEPVVSGPIPTAFISDIDKAPEGEAEIEPIKKPMCDTATIRFTPVGAAPGVEPTVSMSTMTKPIVLPDNIFENDDKAFEDENFEETDFEQYVPKEEITDLLSAKKVQKKFARLRRNGFLRYAASLIITVILALFLIPPLSNILDYSLKGSLITCAALFGLTVIANIDMLKGFINVANEKCDCDVNASLTSVCIIALSIISIINEVNCYPVILLGQIILLARAVTCYYNAAVMFGNLKIISVKRKKNAVCLIGDTSTTTAMSGKSIDGDVLVTTSRKADVITDFMKYSTFRNKMSGKVRIITAISFAVSLLLGLSMGFIQKDAVDGLFTASVTLCLASLPCFFFIDSLPLHSAAQKLNKKGAMLTGFAAAEKLEESNAVVVRTADIFPSGTVTMQTMKVLSENSVDDILLRAASLTDSLSSPLSPIFKKIVGTSSSYEIPDSDTVKYEKRLGISGWVDDELLFVGNRALLESHGISVPSLDIDKKILQQGYFPVYVATAQKACVLVVIKYTVDPKISKQLRDITNLGITVLFENTDPNLNEEMICDYFDLSEEAIHIINNAGYKMHKSATENVKVSSSPAAFRGNSLSLLSIMSCSSKIKKSNIRLTVLYLVTAIAGIVYFIYSLFSLDSAAIDKANAVLLYSVSVTALSLLAYLIKKH